MTLSTRPAARLRVVEAIDPAAAVDVVRIAEALAHPQVTSRASDFPGRTSTQVWASGQLVVKSRAEFQFASGDVDRWVAARVARERAIGCYPADRTWVVSDDGAYGTLGVATSRLRPLHLWSDAELAAGWAEFAQDFVRLYLDAAEQGWRLDEGMSNFARTPEGLLRYLDDDLYPWDAGTGLAVALDVVARRYRLLDHGHGSELGAVLRDEVRRRPQLLALRHVADTLRGGGGGAFALGVAEALTRHRTAPAAPRAEPVATSAPVGSLPALAVDSGAPASVARAGGTGRTLVIADVHANLDALDAVLATDDARAATRIVVLGDTVGYGPDPLAVVRRLAVDPRVVGVLGNHDLAAIAGAPPTFNADARWSAEWTSAQLDDPARSWLEAQPRELHDPDGWFALHGAPIDPERLNAYVYRMTADDNLAALELDGIRICLHGNTHIAGSWVRRHRGAEAEFVGPEREFDYGGVRAALVCPGGLGQPRDGLTGAAYAVLDPTAFRIRFERVAYDHAAVQQRMRDSGFPHKLVERLDRAG